MTDSESTDKPWHFKPGNRFWEARSSFGRKPLFAKPEDLWEASVQYFHWAEENPLYESKPMLEGSKVKMVQVPKMRAMTASGLCVFLDIGTSTWDDYKKREAFSEVTRAIEDVMRTQKFEGASAGFLNANIIARDLGLADRAELTGKDGDPIKTESKTDLSGLSTAQLAALASIRIPADG